MAVATKTRRKKKSATKKSSRSKTKTKSLEDLVAYAGEGELVGGSQSILEHIILVYGESAIGKTSTCHNIPNSYIIQCDVKRKGLVGRQSFIPNTSLEQLREENPKYTPWSIAKATIKKAAEDPTVDVVVIDNFDYLYDHCLNNKCYRLRIADPGSMNDYGATWREIEDELTAALNIILENDKGCVIITHAKEVEIELPDGSKYERIQPQVKSAPFRWLKACTDYAFYLCYGDEGDRVWQIRAGKEIWLKCCVDEDNAPHFMDPDGTPLKQISAGSSPKEAWNNLVAAWNNEMRDIDYRPPRNKTKKKRRSRTAGKVNSKE